MKPAPLHKLVGDVRIVVRGPIEPSDEEFEAHVAEALAMAPSVRVVLVIYQRGTRISPKQRAWLVRTGLFDVPHAVLLDGVTSRAEIMSVSALGAPIRTFATNEFDEACEFLAIPASSRQTLLRQIAALKEQLVRDGAPSEPLPTDE